MKTVYSLLVLIVLLVGGFFVLNTYLYNEKQGESLPDGTHLGFIHAFTDNNLAIDFDNATWLTGPEAYDAALRAGICTRETRDECLPNGYFIENTDKKDVSIRVLPEATVIMQTWMMEETGSVEGRDISRPALAELINDSSKHWRELPYTITIFNTTITHIEEVYIP